MNSKNKISTNTMVMVAMFAAVLAVLSQIAIPMPSGVPVTLQTFAVALTAAVLGGKRGTMATTIYILLGAVGVPVFTGFKGGVGAIAGMTGGFIYGFLFMVVLCGVAVSQKNIVLKVILSGAGLLLCHFTGTLQFSILSGQGFWESALLVSIPYLIKDVVSIVAAFMVGAILRKALNAANILRYEKI